MLYALFLNWPYVVAKVSAAALEHYANTYLQIVQAEHTAQKPARILPFPMEARGE